MTVCTNIIMKQSIYLSFVFITLFFGGCSHPSNNQLTGVWNLLPDKKSGYEFKGNNEFLLKTDHEILVKGKYTIRTGYDSLYLCTTGPTGILDSIPMRFIYKIEGNLLYLCDFKNAPGIKDHIDEVGVYEKMNLVGTRVSKPVKDTTKTQVIVFEGNLIGNYGINYQQQDGEESVDSKGRMLVHSSENGLFNTKFKADPFEYIKNNFIFMNKDHKVIPSFIMGHSSKSQKELLSRGFNNDSVYVCLYGYNQGARDEVNRFFNKQISGQVLMFRVDTLKNFLNNPKFTIFPMGVR